jgi:hypothetical protein
VTVDLGLQLRNDGGLKDLHQSEMSHRLSGYHHRNQRSSNSIMKIAKPTDKYVPPKTKEKTEPTNTNRSSIIDVQVKMT